MNPKSYRKDFYKHLKTKKMRSSLPFIELSKKMLHSPAKNALKS